IASAKDKEGRVRALRAVMSRLKGDKYIQHAMPPGEVTPKRTLRVPGMKYGVKKAAPKLDKERLRQGLRRKHSDILGKEWRKRTKKVTAKPQEAPAKPTTAQGHITTGDGQTQEVKIGDAFTLSDGRKVRVKSIRPNGEAELEVIQ
ncbi:unnamed protein product, partial [marine sediment metagenome]